MPRDLLALFANANSESRKRSESPGANNRTECLRFACEIRLSAEQIGADCLIGGATKPHRERQRNKSELNQQTRRSSPAPPSQLIGFGSAVKFALRVLGARARQSPGTAVNNDDKRERDAVNHQRNDHRQRRQRRQHDAVAVSASPWERAAEAAANALRPARSNNVAARLRNMNAIRSASFALLALRRPVHRGASSRISLHQMIKSKEDEKCSERCDVSSNRCLSRWNCRRRRED